MEHFPSLYYKYIHILKTLFKYIYKVNINFSYFKKFRYINQMFT